MSLRIALFTLEALANAASVRRFVRDHADMIVCVGLSNAGRPNAGGFLGQTWRHLRRSGPHFLPYLAVNFGLPDFVYWTDGVFGRLRRAPRDVAMTPLRALCRDLNIPAFVVDDVNGSEVSRRLTESKLDLIVSFHFDQIFSAETLSLAPLGGINVHPSLLPRHRGPVPTVHALAEPNPTFGVTVHRLAETIDAGAVLIQTACDLPAGSSASSASIFLHEHGRRLLGELLADVSNDSALEGRTIEPLPYCPFPSPALLRLVRKNGHRLVGLRDVLWALAIRRPPMLRDDGSWT